MAYRRIIGLGSTVDDALSAAATRYGIPLSLLQSVARTESSLNPNAVSPAGAQGLMQLMPATAASLGVSNPFDPGQSADGGARYLQSLYGKYGNWNDALIAYNEGPGTFGKGVIYPGSQSYADSILAASGLNDSSAADTGPVDDSGGDGGAEVAGLSPMLLAGLVIAGIAAVWAVAS